MDRGAWWATVHGVTEESDMTERLTLSGISFTKEIHVWSSIEYNCLRKHFEPRIFRENRAQVDKNSWDHF